MTSSASKAPNPTEQRNFNCNSLAQCSFVCTERGDVMLADATSGMKHLLKHGEKFATRRALCDQCGTDALSRSSAKFWMCSMRGCRH